MITAAARAMQRKRCREALAATAARKAMSLTTDKALLWLANYYGLKVRKP